MAAAPRGRQGAEDAAEWRTVEMSSEGLGLVGKADCFRRREGGWVPYEHKRGRARKEGRTPVPWPSDALQVSAYGMLLEEALGEPVAEGRVRYHADNVTVRVPLDAAARQSVRQAVLRAAELRASPERPPVTPSEGRCIRCSLAPVCLPEEERLAERPEWEPVRLFPPDRERSSVHVVGYADRVGRKGDALVVQRKEGDEAIPAAEVEALIVHGYAQVTAQALALCGAEGIAVHWFTPGGWHVGAFHSAALHVHRRLRQYRALTEPAVRLRLAKRLAIARAEGQIRYLLRSTRGAPRPPETLALIQRIRASLRGMAHAETEDALRGHEGAAAAAYFAALPALLSPAVPQEMRFATRTRRPPKDRFSALLNFAYALLYARVLQSVLSVGLEPALGFFHKPRTAAPPLVLDLMELFRVPLGDIPVIGSVNRLQWDPEADFDSAAGRVWLSAAGKRKIVSLFENRLDETWRHPVVNYSLTYARLIELEVRLLEKEWTGSPGLFARFRLR